ncbi:MAG: TM2 domain-containing protein [Lachnospiraceae bacterium]|nr:TM2 domain-containing protein [Lachnospiraceae bacterium]
MDNNTTNQSNANSTENTKFCKHCGAKIPAAAVVCTHCGCQVEEIKQTEQPSIVINNSNNNTNANTNINGAMPGLKPKNKWVAFLLCFFLGYLGIHKFYEGRIGAGILYLLTLGLFGFGWIIDCIILLFKPNPYYVR